MDEQWVDRRERDERAEIASLAWILITVNSIFKKENRRRLARIHYTSRPPQGPPIASYTSPSLAPSSSFPPHLPPPPLPRRQLSLAVVAPIQKPSTAHSHTLVAIIPSIARPAQVCSFCSTRPRLGADRESRPSSASILSPAFSTTSLSSGSFHLLSQGPSTTFSNSHFIWRASPSQCHT